MTNKEISQAINLTHGSVKKAINGLKKKINLAAEESLRDYMVLHF